MSFGLEIRNNRNAVIYSSDSVTWNQVDLFFVPGNGSASKTYPIISGREVLTAQVQINAPPTTRKATAHTVTVSGTTVTASGGSEDAYIFVLMR